VHKADNLTIFTCRISWKYGSLNLLEPSGPHRTCYGTPFTEVNYPEGLTNKKQLDPLKESDTKPAWMNLTNGKDYYLGLGGAMRTLNIRFINIPRTQANKQINNITF
jgi:hypothetical protein